mgnify:CR=1 FL=1
MAIKPILFNTEMVQANLDGRKTCTRRKIPIDIVNNCDVETDGTLLAYENCYGDFIDPVRLCRYQPGDILYVRETWHKGLERYIYRADYSDTEKFYRGGKEIEMKWRPSIHMPKEAARIWLKVTDVRVERLQDVTEDGAKAEGAIDNRGFIHSPENEYDRIHTAREHFIEIWNSTIKKSDLDRYGWDANPYVFVIEFERCEKPEGV